MVIQIGPPPPPPTIASFTPTSGPVGANVIITGNNFTGANQVKFNGVTASFAVNSNTQITTTVPTGATTGPISVTTPGGTAASATNFTVTAPPPSSLVFNPKADAYVNANNASTNFGTAPTLRAKQSSPIVNSYLKFVVTGISGTIQSAKLRLKVTAASNSSESVYFVTINSWSETGITFSNAPIISGSPLSTVSSGTVGQWVEFDVKAAITGNATFSFGLKSASTATVQYSSREGADKPELVIQFTSSTVAAKTAETKLENEALATPTPERLELFANYPNPFNPQTTIAYDLPEATQVRLVIYNMLGQVVRTLVDEPQLAGNKRVIWDGRNELGQQVSTGVYLYQLQVGRQQLVRRMVFQK